MFPYPSVTDFEAAVPALYQGLTGGSVPVPQLLNSAYVVLGYGLSVAAPDAGNALPSMSIEFARSALADRLKEHLENESQPDKMKMRAGAAHSFNWLSLVPLILQVIQGLTQK